MIIVAILALVLVAYVVYRIYNRRYWDKLFDKLNVDKLVARIPYDPRNSDLQTHVRFQPVLDRTHCLFAPRAKIWASPDWDESLSLEDNLARSVPALAQFVNQARSLIDCFYDHLVPEKHEPWQDMLNYFEAMKEVRYPKKDASYKNRTLGKLFNQRADAFLIEIRGKQYVRNFSAFKDTMRRAVTCLHDLDPLYGGKRPPLRVGDCPDHYQFTFCREHFLYVTFSPTYDHHHARCMFGGAPDSCFILIQSESTAHFFDMGRGYPLSQVQWDKPRNMRERIRARFKEEGRMYDIAENPDGAFPTSHSVCNPEKLGECPVKWWIKDEEI